MTIVYITLGQLIRQYTADTSVGITASSLGAGRMQSSTFSQEAR
jgi:hypothetical protein